MVGVAGQTTYNSTYRSGASVINLRVPANVNLLALNVNGDEVQNPSPATTAGDGSKIYMKGIGTIENDQFIVAFTTEDDNENEKNYSVTYTLTE